MSIIGIIMDVINNIFFNNINMTWIKWSWERLSDEWLTPEWLSDKWENLELIEIIKEKLNKDIFEKILIKEPKNYILNIIDNEVPYLLKQVYDLFSEIKVLELSLNTLDSSNKLSSLRELVSLHKQLIILLSWLVDTYIVLKNQIPWLNTKLNQYEKMLVELEALDKKILEFKDKFKSIIDYIGENFLNYDVYDEIIKMIYDALFKFRWYEKYLNVEIQILEWHKAFLEDEKEKYDQRNRYNTYNVDLSISQAEEILWLTRGYTKKELKVSYRKKINTHHPDKNPWNIEAEEISKKINLAYELLLKQFD